MPEDTKNTNVQPDSQNVKDTQDQKTDSTPQDEESTVTKQIEKMRKRIDAEAGRKNQYKDQLEKSQSQVKSLTEQLKKLQGKDDENGQPDELKKMSSENEKLKAQLVRRDQMDSVASQFAQAGVTVPKDVLRMAVPAGISEDQVTKNMTALSSWYDSIVSKTKDSFLAGRTPRVGGSDQAPFDMSKVAKIKDANTRIAEIKKHLDDFK